jgi:hypothetical protein
MKKQKAKIRSKENNLDEINPVSERGSMQSLNKSNMYAFDRKTYLPPHKNTLKEKSMAQLSNLSYYENFAEDRSQSRHNMTMNNTNMREAISCTNKFCKNHGYNMQNQSIDCHSMCRNSIMTPVNHVSESFIIQPH